MFIKIYFKIIKVYLKFKGIFTNIFTLLASTAHASY